MQSNNSESTRYRFADFRRNFASLPTENEFYYNSTALWKTIEYRGIEILVEYNFDRGVYLCHFRNLKSREEYAPKEVEFDAFTWETLQDHINTELRTTTFQEFVGILNKRKISTILRDEFAPIFEVKEEPEEEY
jgi:hypothetical protein